MFDKEILLHLQKLAAISLNDNEIEKFWNQLWIVVDFLGKLKNIPSKLDNVVTSNKSLSTLSWVCVYKDYKLLFDNAKHEKTSNSLMISSVVDN